MAMSWTQEQQQVIWSRNRNLLVSAAAGSGKTAVLVERIIQMITDQEQPLDIDRLLVMTFTNAAASEMRERISNAIEEQLSKRPYDEHLQRQATLVQYAQITTIDSFCLNLIRNYFDRIEIDPSFRIGDEGELKLLQSDVMEQLLESYYETGGDVFEQFVDTYAVGKADHGIDDYIYQTYHFSMSNPWPKEWIETGLSELTETDQSQWINTKWMKFLLNDVANQISQLIKQMKAAIEICQEDGGPYMYLPTLVSELQSLEQIRQADQYEELNEELNQFTFGRLAAARDKSVDPDRKEAVTGHRNRIKKAILKLKAHYCLDSLETVVHDMEKTKDMVAMLLHLTHEYTIRYQQAKKDKNIVDFNDLEHYALNLLVKQDAGIVQYTELADLLCHQYQEIFVDEYQDSNLVQETLINSLSRERFNQPNVFMVGDVKQSIYKFRLARPELFMDKYASYSIAESSHQKIELHLNFRSRDQVLNGINEIFYRIMTQDLGNIEYNQAVALNCGADFAPCDGKVAELPELLLIQADQSLIDQLDDEDTDFTIRELEAKAIANKIKSLTDPDEGLLIWDKRQQQYRVADYPDIVILLRSMSGWSEIFAQILTNEGIPAHADSSSGYFDTIEIEVILSMLAVLDNPMQDIPLTAVLRSPIVGLTDQELSFLVANVKVQTEAQTRIGIYGAVAFYLEQGQESDQLWQKLNCFEALIKELRFQCTYLTTHQVLYEVYKKSGYYDYACAMPGGRGRKANLDMLVEKAVAYEKTSYKGLFHFIRYIEKLKKYDTDFGEALTVGEQDRAIRIMSIHKSKGLEFPVVILAGMGKQFNKQDVRSKILIDPELGIGTDYLDLELRTKSSTLKKEVIKRKIELDNLGEELRVLYVALTRAKEKLIMTAADKNIDKKFDKWNGIPIVGGQIPSSILATANSYLDWILMSISAPLPELQVTTISVLDVLEQEKEEQVMRELSKDEIAELAAISSVDSEFNDQLSERLSYQYPYLEDVSLYTKVSVSEIKKRSQVPDQSEWQYDYQRQDMAYDHQQTTAALRGTAYHRVLELLDFTRVERIEDLEQQLAEFISAKQLEAESAATVDLNKIWSLIDSSMGERIKQAQITGHFYRERQFVIGLTAADLNLGQSQESVLVQGMIDAYFEEEDQLVLIDYKTDWVSSGQEQVLAQRYALQLNYYRQALEQITNKKVKESILYSFSLQKAIYVDEKTGY